MDSLKYSRSLLIFLKSLLLLLVTLLLFDVARCQNNDNIIFRSNSSSSEEIQNKCNNGGIYLENKCMCPIGYGGKYCNRVKCENGGIPIEINGINMTNRCTCEEEWGGSKCLMCLNDDACDEETICKRNSPLTDITKIRAHCKVIDQDVAKTFGDSMEIISAEYTSDSLHSKNGTIFTYGWKTFENRNEPTIFCALSNCGIKHGQISNDGRVLDIVKCLETSCKCIGNHDSDGVCNKYVKRMVESIHGLTTVTCIGNAGEPGSCDANFSSLSWKTDLKCESSSCVSEIINDDPPLSDNEMFSRWITETANKWKYYWVVYGIVVIFLFLSMCACLFMEGLMNMKRKYEFKKIDDNTPFILSIENMSYYVTKVPRLLWFLPRFYRYFRKYIIEDLSFTINRNGDPGHFHLIFGMSGNGKTTLLKSITKILDVGTVEGKVSLNGMLLSKSNAKSIMSVGYDKEIFDENLTVSEIMKFSASMKSHKKLTTVEAKIILSELGIGYLENRKIGPQNHFSMSRGEFKRVITANAIAQSPRILILDEPTSEMDDLSSERVMSVLKEYSKKNLVLIVGHSIGSYCYKMFDGITIFANGKIIKSGSKKNVDDFISKNTRDKLNSDKYENIKQFISNISDSRDDDDDDSDDDDEIQLLSNNQTEDVELNDVIIMEANGNDEGAVINKDTDDLTKENFNSVFDGCVKNIKKKKKNRSNIELLPQIPLDDCPLYEERNIIKFSSPYAVSYGTQFKNLLIRDIKILLRNKTILWFQFGIYMMCASFLGIYAHSLKNDMSGVGSRIGTFSGMILIISISSIGSVWRIVNEFNQMLKETDSKLYHPWIYLSSKLITDFITLRVAPIIIFCIITYTSMGVMSNNWWTTIYKYTIMCTIFSLISLISSVISLAISFIFQTPMIFTVIINMVLIILSFMNGVFINKDSVRDVLKNTYYVSFVKFAAEALFINEFLGSKVVINPKGLATGNLTLVLDGKFYLDQMSLDSTAMERDIFISTIFFSGCVLVLYPLFSLALYLKKKK